MTKLYNKTSEKEKRQSLRNKMPPAEQLVWARLKGKQVENCKFRRQYSVGAFVIDFYSVEIKLAIEIDGESHFQDGAEIYDRERQSLIESAGVRFVRFTNQQVYEELDAVIESISQMICALRELPQLSSR
jgi:very-short-patch-repair endonuclease